MSDQQTGATSESVRWGILGVSRIGTRAVFPAMLAALNTRVVALASRDLARAEYALAGLPGMHAYGSYEALLEDPEVEAVYISLPNGLHAEWVTRAAAAGKHVLCEKTLGMTPDETRAMVGACERAGVLLMEAFMYRHHPQIEWALAQIADGEIGRVQLVRGGFGFNIAGRPDDIRLIASLGGGSLLDVGCYPLNFARAIYGRGPVSAAAKVVVPAGSEVERSVAAALDFDDGQLAVIDSNFLAPRDAFAEVVGDLGRLFIPRPFTPGRSDTVVRIERDDEIIERRFEGVDQYQLEVERFGLAIRTGTPPFLPPADAIEQADAIAMIYAAAGYAWPR
ncbi:MAG TPA: Gfo/Idh/MocA family oxidoreductase [Ktedonobacterales bacterium]|jgi:predicted dehydrogenase